MNRNKLLTDRAPQILKSFVKSAEVGLESEAAKVVLKMPYKVPAASTVCQACQQTTPTHLPLCGHCGAKNASWSEAAAAVAKGGKAHGYTKQKDVFDIQAALEAIPEKGRNERYNFMGDLLTEMKGRKRKADQELEGPVFLKVFQTKSL